jgi:hypothetical protein
MASDEHVGAIVVGAGLSRLASALLLQSTGIEATVEQRLRTASMTVLVSRSLVIGER